MSGIDELTDNLMAFKLTKNIIKAPNSRRLEAEAEANKELTFKPKINKLSE